MFYGDVEMKNWREWANNSFLSLIKLCKKSPTILYTVLAFDLYKDQSEFFERKIQFDKMEIKKRTA